MTFGATIFLLASVQLASAAALDGDVVGSVMLHTVEEGESLIEIARAYDVGYGEIAAANPELDPFVPAPGATVVVPTAWIPPRAAAPGTLVVNLSEMRLYLTSPDGTQVTSFPLGIGSEGTETPLGVYRVVAKVIDPWWHVPPSIREERPDLPDAVPPGPDNPLGTHALRLSAHSILIHGTNKPFGIGRKVSHGCMRLYPEDIVLLFEMVPVGTPVRIVREPVKVALYDDRPHVEVHRDLESDVDPFETAQRLFARLGVREDVDIGKLLTAIRLENGMPVDVSRQAGQPAAATSLAPCR